MLQKRAKPLAKLGLILGNIVVQTCTGLSLPIKQFESAFGEVVGGPVSDMFEGIEAVAVEALTNTAESLGVEDEKQRLRHLLDAKKVG